MAAADYADNTCQWFYLCTNRAVATIDHPILGKVPACQRCADKRDARKANHDG